MKIRTSNGLIVDSGTLIRLEWRKFYPVLAIHEKFEKHLKWTLRLIGFIGIGSSIIAIEKWYYSLGLALVIFIIEQFFERTAIEFTTMVVQPPPNFEIDLKQWKTNGFIIPIDRGNEVLAHFGPTYEDEKYASNFFDYLRSWVNDDSLDDTDNSLVVSIVIEPNEEYTSYIYANLNRKRLDEMFRFLGGVKRFEKYGKRQQEFIAQMFYWNTLDFKEGSYIQQFLNFYQEGDPFFFTPSVIQPFGLPPKFLLGKSIKKYHLKVRRRHEVTKDEPEFMMKPEKKIKVKNDHTVLWRRSDEARVLNDIRKTFSKAEDLGFIANGSTSVGVINMCFTDCVVPYEAYKELIRLSNSEDVYLDLKDDGNLLRLEFRCKNIIEPILMENIPLNRNLLNEFLEVDGGGDKVVFTVGYPPAESRRLILGQEINPLVVIWSYSRL